MLGIFAGANGTSARIEQQRQRNDKGRPKTVALPQRLFSATPRNPRSTTTRGGYSLEETMEKMLPRHDQENRINKGG
jgi:hypothetical protein